MTPAWMQPRRLFNRRVAKTLFWIALLVMAAMAVNIVGIQHLGSVTGWEVWLAEVSGYFLLWRLGLYGMTSYGWIWMRRRILARETGAEEKCRLVRAEIASVTAIVILEACLLVQQV